MLILQDLNLKPKTMFKSRLFISLVALVLLLFASLFSTTSDFRSHVTEMTALLSTDSHLYKNAYYQLIDNKDINTVFGKIEPIQLNVLEDHVTYSDSKNTIEITTKIKGDKSKGKLDIVAKKIDNKWYYTKMKARTKHPHQDVVVIE